MFKKAKTVLAGAGVAAILAGGIGIASAGAAPSDNADSIPEWCFDTTTSAPVTLPPVTTSPETLPPITIPDSTTTTVPDETTTTVEENPDTTVEEEPGPVANGVGGVNEEDPCNPTGGGTDGINDGDRPDNNDGDRPGNSVGDRPDNSVDNNDAASVPVQNADPAASMQKEAQYTG